MALGSDPAASLSRAPGHLQSLNAKCTDLKANGDMTEKMHGPTPSF